MANLVLVFEIEDASGDKSTTSVQLVNTTTVVNATGFAVAFATALNNLISGIIRSCAAFLGVDISALTDNLMSDTADVEHIGKFEFLTDGGNRVKLNLPCLDEILVGTTTTDAINQSQADVAALIAAMEDGINAGGALIEPCDVGEDDIVSVVFSREAFRNSGARR